MLNAAIFLLSFTASFALTTWALWLWEDRRANRIRNTTPLVVNTYSNNEAYQAWLEAEANGGYISEDTFWKLQGKQ